jgi:hypothetical protein
MVNTLSAGRNSKEEVWQEKNLMPSDILKKFSCFLAKSQSASRTGANFEGENCRFF